MIKYLSAHIKGTGKRTRSLLLSTLALTLILGIFIGVVHANVRITIPPHPYAPIYVDWYGDDQWVAFIFFRPPELVPGDFDLYSIFFDENALSLPLTIKGFVINENPNDFIPRKAILTGLGAVPVWFVSRSDYEDAVQDWELTIVELEGLPSLLKGYATFFKETLEPGSKVNIVAKGILEDNEYEYESFWFHALYLMDGNVNVNIELE